MLNSRWNGRVVALTGASSGIGRALALALAKRGAQLALSDWDHNGLEETASQCRDVRDATIRCYQVDVSDREAIEQYATSVLADFGRVNGVINNAGVSLTAMTTEQSVEDIDWVMKINLNGVIHGTQIFLPHLIDSRDGLVVNISSIFGVIGVPGQSAYNASKFAVRGYTEALAMEMGMLGHPVAVHAHVVRDHVCCEANAPSLCAKLQPLERLLAAQSLSNPVAFERVG